jgi:hypothetical protein
LLFDEREALFGERGEVGASSEAVPSSIRGRIASSSASRSIRSAQVIAPSVCASAGSWV